MESICTRSPFHCPPLKPPNSFNNCFYDTVCFNGSAQRTNPCKSTLLFGENIIQRQVLWYSCWNCKTYRDLQDNGGLSVLISSMWRQTHKWPFERRTYRFSYTGQPGRNWQKLKFHLGPVMVWKNVKLMTKATTRRNGEQVVIAAFPRPQPTDMKSTSGFRFQW